MKYMVRIWMNASLMIANHKLSNQMLINNVDNFP